MVAHNADLVGTAEAMLAFCAVLVAPGYVLAWLFELMDFRRRRLLTRLALAVPTSIGLDPIVTYFLWRFVPPSVWVFYGICAIGFLVLLFRERRELLSGPSFRLKGLLWTMVAGWVLIGTLSLIDMRIGDRLYFPTVAYDYSLRAAVTAAAAHSGVPVHNPLFFPGYPSLLRYHYFWFMLSGVAQRIAGYGVSSRQITIAGCVWCGIGLMALVALYLRFFQNRGRSEIERRTAIALALITVTGLDIFPVAYIELHTNLYYATIEWWNEQVSAWLTTMLWTPNHLAGLIACLMGFLLLWNAGLPEARRRKSAGVAAGLMFSSAVGLTVDVTLVFAVFCVVWTVIELIRKNRAGATLFCLAGGVAVAAALPFLKELFSHQPGAAATPFPLRFDVREFFYFDRMFDLAPHHAATHLVNLLVLPLNYFMELGFFFVVGAIQSYRMWRKRPRVSPDQMCGLAMMLTSITICTFISSAVGTGNDLGWRGFLPAQFILLLWGGELLSDGLLSRSGGNPFRLVIAAILMLGFAGSAYELFKVRFYPLLVDASNVPIYAWLSPDRQLGARTMALREIYDELRRRTPVSAVYQHNPDVMPDDLFHGMYADRQVAIEAGDCAHLAGEALDSCRGMALSVASLFGPGVADVARVDDVCGRYAIDILVVRDTDKAWHDPDSWIWKRQPLLANRYGRAFACKR